ncbi:MAG: glycine--tRNA ligase subunit beta, partial [Alphaproteobacteria bacterium]|nr:glycine--tRNA ligase subunit beta [Alphaproteobacteria bacterium]
MPELLLELFSEEIPARMQARAADDLARLVAAGLKDAGLEHGDVRSFVTPRRLTLVADGLPDKQPDLREEKRGPKVDAPDKAIDGFLQANGVTREQCEERELEKGTFLFAVVEKAGAETASVLPQMLAGIISDLPWQKSMRWGSGSMRWVRSLERILCLFGGRSLTVETRNEVPCGDVTSGHRFLAGEPFSVAHFAAYEKKLRDAKVILDREERKSMIFDGAQKGAANEGLSLRDDPGLLDEVAGLVEWPVVMTGKIDDEFMDVPDEVLITSMRSHQKYFSLLNADGSLAPRFVVVANTEA